jgi:hypothetical protein
MIFLKFTISGRIIFMKTNLISTGLLRIKRKSWRILIKLIGGVFLLAIYASCIQNPVVILPPDLTPSARIINLSSETTSPTAINVDTETAEPNPEDGKCLSINSRVTLDAPEFNVIPLREYSEDVSGPSYYRIHLLHDADSAARNGEFDQALIDYGRVMYDPTLVDLQNYEHEKAVLSAYA